MPSDAYEPDDPKHPDYVDRLLERVDATEHHIEPTC